MKPLRTIDQVETPEGTLALKQRSERDFLITIAGRVLMTSTAHRSEDVLGVVACRRLATYAQPKVLIGGLGMGFTVRAVIDELPKGGRVTVADLNPITETWCRGPLKHLTDDALGDPRVTVEITDVTRLIQRAASAPDRRYDAIVIDLFEGPGAGTSSRDPIYGSKAAAGAAQALTAGGVLSVWGEAFDAAYAQRLERAGFAVRHERPGRGGLRHVVYIAQKR